MRFPDGKQFAFTIIDDTDVATVANVRPVYRLLERLGIGATKTVWPMPCPEGSPNFSESETLEDPEYRDFVRDLQDRGFEVAFHSATMESSERDRTRAALERFREIFGRDPGVHANHAFNRENLYWGEERIDHPVLKWVYSRVNGRSRGFYQGHVPGSAHWWGDLCADHITYVRNLTFDRLNLLTINPTLPYRDPRRPLVPFWFSASDAEDVVEFNRLLQPRRVERLQREGGVCILATHLGKGFARDGEVHPESRRVLESLADRPGWYPGVQELLDWLRQRRESFVLPADEWHRMQWVWARDLLVRKLRQRLSGSGWR